ncbi:MAG: hypothetical protein Q9190_005045, partial [Brigantiaea leucoxantha]
LGFPSRSQSQRTPPSLAYSHGPYQPTIHLVGPQQGQQDVAGEFAIDENPDAYYQQELQQVSQPPREEQKKKRFFGFGGSSNSRESSAISQPPIASSQKLGRSISVRTKHYGQQPTSSASGRPLSQQRWPSASSVSNYPPSASEEDQGRAGLLLSGSRPPIPDKDPIRSSDYSSSQQEHPHARAPPQVAVSGGGSSRPPFDRQSSSKSATWESQARSAQQHYSPQAEHNQPPPSYQPSPSSATSTSSYPLSTRTQQDILHHYHQEARDNSRPSSQQSFGPPSPLHSHPRTFDSPYSSRLNQSQLLSDSHNSGQMAPPPSQQNRDRRSLDLAQQQQNQQGNTGREAGAYQPYQQGTQPQSHPQGPPPQYVSQLGVNNAQGGAYRAAQPSPMVQQTPGEQGRSTPPPSRSRDDLANLDIAQLLTRHDELRKWAFSLFNSISVISRFVYSTSVRSCSD